MHRRLSEPLLRAGLKKGGAGKAEKKTFPVWGAAVWIAHNGREARRGERGHPLYIQFIIDSGLLQHVSIIGIFDRVFELFEWIVKPTIESVQRNDHASRRQANGGKPWKFYEVICRRYTDTK